MAGEALATDEILVTVVLPCLNEESSVGECIDEATAALKAAGMSCEVLVVDNNSTDQSVAVARAHGARVIHERRPGYGSALRTGIESAFGEIVVMADADLTYDLSKIARLVQPVADGNADLVLGERLSEAPSSTMPFLHRRVGTPALTLLVRRAANGLTVTDSQSGYRAFRRDAILSLGLRSTGMEFASEMLIRAGRAGLRVTETSTGYRERVGVSKLNTFSDGWRHIRQILLLAPHLMLVAPGLVLMAFGVALQVVGLVVPAGLIVGSLRWQPSFISGIALIIGAQALIAGFVLTERQRAVLGKRPHPHSPKRPSLPATCLVIGLVVFVAGLVIDVVLLIQWIEAGRSFSRALALAAMAQSYVVDGASLIGFGLIYPIVARGARGPDADDGDAGRADGERWEPIESSAAVTADREAPRSRPGQPTARVRGAAPRHLAIDDASGRARHSLTFGLLVVSALSFAANAVFSRLLGKAGYGAVGSVLALASLLAIPLSAIQAAVTRQVAVAEPGAYRLYRPIAVTAVGAVLVTLTAFLLVPVLDPLLHLSGDAVIVLFGAYLGAILLEGVPRGVLVGERRYAWVGLVAAAGALLRLGVGWGWIAVRPDAAGPLAGAAVGEFATALALLALVVLRGRRGPRDASLQIHDVWLSMAGFTGLLSLMSIDTVAARHWLSAGGSGYYAAASAGGSIAYFVAAAAATAIFPDIAKGASARYGRSFWVGLGEVSALALGTSALLALASPLVIDVVFGHRYAQARGPLEILALSYGLLGVLAYLVSHHLAHKSRTVYLPWIGAAVLVAAVLLAHGSATSVAFDALGASASLMVLMGGASLRLEWRMRHDRAAVA